MAVKERLGMEFQLMGRPFLKHRLHNIPKLFLIIFFVLSSSADILVLEEGEFQQLEEQDGEAKTISGSIDQSGEAIPELPRIGESLQQNHSSPIGAKSSPSYAEITKNKSVDSSGSSNEDSIE